MDSSIPSPLFAWPTGKPERWAIVTTDVVAILTYGGEWPSHEEGPEFLYLPLDHPEIYEEFAAIGALALSVSHDLERLVSHRDAGLREQPPRADLEPSYAFELAAAAATAGSDKLLQKRLLQFVRVYGSPRDLTDTEGEPRRFGEGWSVGIVVGELLWEAALLHRALELCRDIEQRRKSYDADATELLAKMDALCLQLTARTQGTRLLMLVDSRDPRDPKLWPTSTCDDLIGAMWLQLYEAVSRGGAWRSCEGCGRLFHPRREKQTYHNPACRNRANVRRSAAKKSNTQGER